MNENKKLCVEELNTLKETALGVIDNLNTKIDYKIEFVKNEVQVKADSFKAQLDDAEQGLVKNLEKTKEDFKAILKRGRTKVEQLEIPDYKEESNEMTANEEYKNKLKTKIDSLNVVVTGLKQCYLNAVIFDNESFKIDNESIGFIRVMMHPLQMEVKKLLSFELEYIELNEIPNQVLKLNNGCYLISNVDNTSTFVYDSNLKLIMKKEHPIVVSITKDETYCFMAALEGVIKMKHDCANYESISYPNIAYYGHLHYIELHYDQLYLCIDNFILIFSKNVHLIKVHRLNKCKHIFKIKMIDNVACLSCLLNDYTHSLSFYKLPNLDFIRNVEMFEAAITTLNSYFYAYDNDHITCLNRDGEIMIIKDLKIGRPLDMTIIDGDFYISLSDNKNLVKLRLNA